MAKRTIPGRVMFEAKRAQAVFDAIVLGIQKRVGKDLAVVDPKGTCVHVNAGEDGTAYLGLHPRVGGVRMTIRTKSPLKSKRIIKAEQASKNRCHCDVMVLSVEEVDEELLGWMEMAAGLVATRE